MTETLTTRGAPLFITMNECDNVAIVVTWDESDSPARDGCCGVTPNAPSNFGGEADCGREAASGFLQLAK